MTALEWWKTREKVEPSEGFPAFTEGLIAWLAGLPSVPPELEALCHYAEDVRQGRWVDRVAPEQAMQAIYLAMVQAGDREQIPAFFEVIAKRASEPLTTTAFFAAEPRFQKYIAALIDDQRLYREDLARSQTWRLSIGARSVRVLVLDKPASTQFKLWARRNDDFALLLVRQSDGTLVLTADPSSKLKVDWAAPLLTKLDAHPWYAGERHEGTLIASAKEGTRLGFDDVRRAIGARVPTGRALLAVPVLFAFVAASVALLRPQPAAEPARAKGEPLAATEVLNLLARADGPASFESYALIAGVCSYTGERALAAPCNDARKVRETLVTDFGYRPENVLSFIDDEAEGPKPDAPSLKLAVERFREKFPRASPNSSFLFYYSGHGGYEKGARKDFGVLQPAGYFEHADQPMATRGWDMQELIDDLRKGVPSKHVMVVLDACYSGWAVGAKGEQSLSPEVRSLWAERAEVVLSAGTRGQRAWEDGDTSVFTRYLIDGLKKGADLNGDRVVTDEELAVYVSRGVAQTVMETHRASQVPQFFRFDEALPKSGQFLFVRPP